MNYLQQISMISSFFLFFAISCMGQTFVQFTTDIRLVEKDPLFNTNIYAAKDINEKWGISYFALITEGWGEAYFGPYWKPNSEWSLGISFGLEVPAPHWRFGSAITWFRDAHAFQLFLEQGSGSDNYWYSLWYENTPNKIGFGLMAKRFYGSGLTLSYAFKYLKVVVAGLYDLEDELTKPAIFFIHTF